MKHLSSQILRSEFLNYFRQQGHQICSSYPLVPPNDPTLLFTNAGMVQFKDVFTGKEHRDFKRAASSQKCVRAGGKHNDLENVGFTARHHTFFEMLGNFSFGDYFKRDAIRYSWEFLVDRLKLPKERLWITVFSGEPHEKLPPDDEAAELWHSQTGVPKNRILRFGKKDNFWSMGETGPCGPCSEIHFDQGERVPCHVPTGCTGVGCECDRFLEVWNLVFMQYERDARGNLTPLPAPSIDTGMGLERLSAILQGCSSNYSTDLFLPLIKKMEDLSQSKYGSDAAQDVSLRVIADHARATAFLLADGVLPSNEGRGYVLRRIMRRAIRHGHKLGVKEIFFHCICLEVAKQMGEVYPELIERKDLLEKATRLEEETFRRTLENGLKILHKEISQLKQSQQTILPGSLVFDLQTRDGFPVDLTAVIARENGLEVDLDAFQKAFEHHQKLSSGSLGLKAVDEVFRQILQEVGATEFVGYQGTEGRGSIRALFDPIRGRISQAKAGETVDMVISPTPFYGEAGGQIGDTGKIFTSGFKGSVVETNRPMDSLIVHRVIIEEGEIRVGDPVSLSVDLERRQAIRSNHSATHLVQAALRTILGNHVNQKGSLVAPDRLRFDFSHFSPMGKEEIEHVEIEVNRMIRENLPVEIVHTDLSAARKAGATMLFGEKYSEKVRMVRMGDQSLELCGGTHTDRTGDIGIFKIIAESSVQAGVRRIEAVTGREALRRFQRLESEWLQAAEILRTTPALFLDRLQTLVEKERKLGRDIEALKQQLAGSNSTSDPVEQARNIAGIKILALQAHGIELSGLRDFADRMRDRLGGGVVLAAVIDGGKLSLVCSVSKELTDRIRAGELLKAVCQITGGKGGGRPDFAQGGGGDPAKLAQGFEKFYLSVEQTLSSKS